MIQDTPIDYILVSEEIIAYFKEHSTKELNDGIYVTLTDHIANTIERIRLGIDFDMTMLLNVKSLYREEYKLAYMQSKCCAMHFIFISMTTKQIL